MQTRGTIETDTLDSPGVHLSYDFVIPSYEWAISRRDAANSRIQHLMIFAMSLTAAAVVLAESLNKPASSLSFFLAAICALAAVGIGLYDLSKKKPLSLIRPSTLYEGWRDCSTEAEFKNGMLKVAGNNFDRNLQGIGSTANRELWMSGLLVVEAVFLVYWLIS